MKKLASIILCVAIVLSTCTVFGTEKDQVDWKTLYDAKMNQIISEYKNGIRDDANYTYMWGEGSYYFALLDINFDGVPELYHTLCSYFELDPETSPEYEEIYYIKDGKVVQGTIQASGDLGLLPMYAGRMEDPGVLDRNNRRWQFVMKDVQTGEICFLVHDGYSGMADNPERRYDKLIFDSKTGVVKSENLLFQSSHSYAEPQYLQGFEYIAAGSYNTYTQDAFNIANWKAGYLAPKVTWMDETVEFDNPPVIVDSRTLVPIRRIAEALGALVDWDENTQTVTITKDDNTVVMIIGQKVYSLNGEEKTMDVPAQIMGGRTMVPVRAVSESLDCHVDWDEDAWTVKITER